jgi:hypothetical protein
MVTTLPAGYPLPTAIDPVTGELNPAVEPPPMLSMAGLRLGNVLIPPIGLLAVALFLGAAWYFSRRRSR